MTKEDKKRIEVVTGMKRARDIATKAFGSTVDTYAVHEVFDYLAQADEADFVSDLEEAVADAKESHGTMSPTPEQVFGIFERRFLGDEE